jgi:hypothetical protein
MNKQQQDEETISEVVQMWDSASIFADAQKQRWAMDEALANGRHLTPRKPGRSKIFVPKIPAYIKRKLTDIFAQFNGDTPITVKNAITASAIGAKVRQRVHNYVLRHKLDYEAIIYNGGYAGLTYNFAPAHLDWEEIIESEDVTETVMNPDGTISVVKSTNEVVLDTYPVISALPPEDVRLDAAASWDDVDSARYVAFEVQKDRAYAEDMANRGLWPRLEEADFTDTVVQGNDILKNERRSTASPFSTTQSDLDNGLINVRYHYYFKELEGEYVAVRCVTLDDSVVLEEAAPLEINWGGNKHAWPFVVGQVYPKPFEQYAPSLPEQAQDLQIEVNAIRNQRRDNVALILNPEKYVTPHAGITASQLAFSYPGKVVTVDNLSAVQWQTVPDVTSAGYKEEATSVEDLDRLFSEGALRAGVEGKRKESATAIQQMSANASANTGLDTAMFMVTFVRPLHEKLGNAIDQKIPEEIYQAAGRDMQLSPNLDPYLLATEGDFVYNVYASATQNELTNIISNNSNIMGIIQTAYGPNANYKPFVDDIVEMAGYDPETIIPSPQQQGAVPDPSIADAGGVDPGAAPSIQPRAQFQGGQMGAGSGNQ